MNTELKIIKPNATTKPVANTIPKNDKIKAITPSRTEKYRV
jgi:hypothetical protein